MRRRLLFLFVTGAKTEEVALMNGLTVNLHLLLVRQSFNPSALYTLRHFLNMC